MFFCFVEFADRQSVRNRPKLDLSLESPAGVAEDSGGEGLTKLVSDLKYRDGSRRFFQTVSCLKKFFFNNVISVANLIYFFRNE